MLCARNTIYHFIYKLILPKAFSQQRQLSREHKTPRDALVNALHINIFINKVHCETHQYEFEEGLVLSRVIQSLFEQIWVDGVLGLPRVLLRDLLQQGCVLPGQPLSSCQFTLYICHCGWHRLVQDGRHCRWETHMEK